MPQPTQPHPPPPSGRRVLLQRPSSAVPAQTSQAGSIVAAGLGSPSLEELRSKISLCTDLEAKLANLTTSSTGTSARSVTSTGASNAEGNKISSEAEASKIRTDLCELYCDVLLSDPDFALRRDASGRLWKSCFYGRIAELRARIGKERAKMKRSMAKSDRDGAERHRLGVEGAERTLDDFLKEAISLYEYLADKYAMVLVDGGTGISSSQKHFSQGSSAQGQLQATLGGGGRRANRELFDPHAHTGHARSSTGTQRRNQQQQLQQQQQQQQPQSHYQRSNSQDAHVAVVAVGVVPTLYKLLLFLGDLWRYSAQQDEAATCYIKASRLAPGLGNPYNQLAVVAQLSDQNPQDHPLTAVALYWYARSLLAIDEPFTTSRTNLDRLFAVNRQWIERKAREQGHDSSDVADVGADEPDACLLLSTDSRSSSRSGSRKAQLDAARAAKTEASRKFLAEFVDLHWDLYRTTESERAASSESILTPMVSNQTERKEGRAGWGVPLESSEAMDKMTSSFSSLLTIAAFSDSLLCKLVCINAFSYYNTADLGSSLEGDRVDKTGFSRTRILSATFILSFGASLAHQLDFNLRKIKKRGNGDNHKKGQLNIRLLSPFVVLCDLVSLFYGGPGCSTSDAVSRQMVLPLCCRFADPRASDKMGDIDATIIATFFRAQAEFWSSVAHIANRIRCVGVFSLTAHTSKMPNNSPPPLPLPKEYEELRGYAPFASIFSFYEPRKEERIPVEERDDVTSSIKACVTPTEAVGALDLLGSNMNTRSLSHGSSKSKECSKSTAEAHARIAHFLSFINRHTGARCTERGPATPKYGQYLFLEGGDDGNVLSVFDTAAPSKKLTSLVGEEEQTDNVVADFAEGTSTPTPHTTRRTNREANDLNVNNGAESNRSTLLVPSWMLLGTKNAGREAESDKLYDAPSTGSTLVPTLPKRIGSTAPASECSSVGVDVVEDLLRPSVKLNPLLENHPEREKELPDSFSKTPSHQPLPQSSFMGTSGMGLNGSEHVLQEMSSSLPPPGFAVSSSAQSSLQLENLGGDVLVSPPSHNEANIQAQSSRFNPPSPEPSAIFQGTPAWKNADTTCSFNTANPFVSNQSSRPVLGDNFAFLPDHSCGGANGFSYGLGIFQSYDDILSVGSRVEQQDLRALPRKNRNGFLQQDQGSRNPLI